MAKAYPIVFSEVKSKVGIDDVAYSLGYALDRKAGVGRYIELVLGDVRNPSDRIVVRNTPDKGKQFYFRRDGSKGDVVSFIRDNINSFNVQGVANEWTRIANILANLANMPVRESDHRDLVRSHNGGSSQVFDPSRYIIADVDASNLPWVIKKRGFDAKTIEAMGGRIVLIKDKGNTKFDGYNIGFPYSRPDNGGISGYEIRGANGYKSKAAGTDSSHSAWMADFPAGCPELSRNVFFFESSFDAMAFYQLNRVRLESSPFSLVSVGGSFNPSLADLIMKRYPAAKAWDCFDNDLAGQLYSASLVKAIDKIEFAISNIDGSVVVKFGDRQTQCPKEQFDFRMSAIELGMKYSVGHWKSPSNFKDWNDCLMGVKIAPMVTTSKYLREENLYRQRQSSLKF